MAKKNNDYLNELVSIAKNQKKVNDGITSYMDKMNDLALNLKSIAKAEKEIKELSEFKAGKQAEVNVLAAKGLAKDKERLDFLREELDFIDEKTKALKGHITSTKETNKELAYQIKNTNKLNLTFKSIGTALAATPGLIKNGFGKLKGTGIFDIDKELRNAATSMNVIGDNFKGFSNNINKANKTTGAWGIGTKDLAKAQQSYSEEIGRSTVLNEEGLVAIGEMAAGTTLGAEGAANMLGEMDKFNISAIKSRDIIEETVQSAAKMGVNSTKAIKTLQTQLKLSQKFHFKGGVKGLTTMANEAARLKLDMEGMAGLADKVFRVEGAVEMAAKLAVMGGEFAKLGDFNTLMFKARNDFGGFTKDIAKATVEFVDFNKETGETQIKGGLAADRMREIATITGIQIEKLQEMASMQKRIQEFGGMIPSVISSDEDRDLIASLATMQNGEATIRIDNKDFRLKDLEKENIVYFKKQQKNLAERAKQSQTFDDVLTNFMNTMKTILLPFVQGLTTSIGDPIQDLLKTWSDEDLYKKLEGWGKAAGDFAHHIGDFITWIGKVFSPTGLLITILTGKALFGMGKWIMNGKWLAQGFNMGSKGFGNSGSPGGLFTKGSSRNTNMMRGMKGGGIAALGGFGLDMANNSGMFGAEGTTTNQAAGYGASALEYGGAGAMIGSFAGPIGTGIGAAVGAAVGLYLESLEQDKITQRLNTSAYGNQPQTAIQDGIVKFDGNDKFINVDKNTMVAGTNKGGNEKLAKSISGGGGGDINHRFEDLNIKIDFNSDSSWLNNIGDDIAKDRTFIRSISTKIQEEIRMAIGGGKLNPNPI